MSLAWGPLSSLPLSSTAGRTGLSEVQTFINAATVEFALMARVKSYDGSSVQTRYLSDVGYLTDSDDDIPDQSWEARIRAFQWRRSYIGSSLGGEATVRAARLSLDNTDASPWRARVDGEAFDRDISVWYGDPSWPTAQLVEAYVGRGSGIERGALDEIPIGLRGLESVFDLQMQQNTYAGTGDQEGGDDLKGKSKVIALGGLLENVAPPLLTNTNIYDLHNDVDGNGAQIESVSAVYDRGVELTQADDNGGDYATYAALKAATTGLAGSGADIEAGEYATCLAEGYIRLGDDPDGQVTVDFKGGHFFGAYQSQPGELARVVMEHYAGLSSAHTSQSLFDQLDTDMPHDLGRWIGTDGASRRQVMDEIARSVFSYWGGNPQGVVEIAQIRKPGGSDTASKTFVEGEPVSVERAPVPSDLFPAVDRITARYRRNYTVQTSDLDANITDAHKRFIQEPWRSDEATISVSTYQEPVRLRVSTLHTTAAGVSALLTAMTNVYDPMPSFFAVTVNHKGLDHDLNRFISVTDAEAGLDDDLLGVGQIDIDYSDGVPRVRMICFGDVTIAS